MSAQGAAVTVTALSAAAKEVLEEAGFRAVEASLGGSWRATTATGL